MEARFRRFLARFLDLALGPTPLDVREFEPSASAPLHALRMGSQRRSQENCPFAIVNVDWAGNFSSYSPELLGLRSPRYGEFAPGHVATDPLPVVLASSQFRAMEADVAAGVRMCRNSCRYFPFCGCDPPGNKHFENGTFAATETLFCRLHEDRPRRGGSPGAAPARAVRPRACGVRCVTTLRSGYRLAVAARFHLGAERESRVSLARGVEEVRGSFFLLGLWRPPTAGELACLLADSKSGEVQDEADALLVFRLPDHLLSAWWDLLDAAAEEGAGCGASMCSPPGCASSSRSRAWPRPGRAGWRSR
jgi:hypothetical protein